MKIVQINATCNRGGTGKICAGISETLNIQNIENYILYSRHHTDYITGIECTERLSKIQVIKSRALGNYGFNSKRTTKKIIRILDDINPDVVHLHNLHAHNCNIEMMMDYFRKNKTRLIWTFHDCWTFTAYCPYFDLCKCDKWKEGCNNCPQVKRYSWILDRSREMYNRKKIALSGLDLTIVTPSQWLANLVKESYLKEYPIKVVNNGINLSVFHPTFSNFRENKGIHKDRYIVLGVADMWVHRKGVDVFISMAKRLNRDKYQIVLVGTDESIDKKLPDNILSIHRTQNQQQLAEIYTAADVFVNPTREENYPTVNMESLACGTPVITFNTGGSPEIIDKNTGIVVECEDIDALEQSIIDACENKFFTPQSCVERAQHFDEKMRYQEYIKLYKEVSK